MVVTLPLDRRSRRNADIRSLSATDFFASDFPGLAQRSGGLVVAGMAALGARPLGLEVAGDHWTVHADDGRLAVAPGLRDDAVRVVLSETQFSDWVQNVMSLGAMMLARSIPSPRSDAFQLSLWDALWVSLLDDWPVVAGDLVFRDRNGAPLDLERRFGPDEDPRDIAHFLREAGYVRLQGWLDRADVERISQDMDRALPTYVEGDGKSWWAKMADGSRRCVRMQEFVERSPTTAAILSGPVWDKLRHTVGGDEPLVQPPVEGRVIEALVKPVGVAAGPSDLPFHRDCHLGRHIYGCAHLTVGIAITPTSADNGLLQVAAGSHRVNMPVEVANSRPYLPVIDLDTEPGDLTVHLSCTLHAATPPQVAERRVLYTGFAQPPVPEDAAPSAALSELRESVTELTS